VTVNIVWTIVIGFLAGAVAKFVMPGKDPGGIVITTVLGIGGALVANFVGGALGFYAEGETGGFIASVLGAIAILAVYRLFRKRDG
jgi:uncharacterized membrane protein YeaQ/YmgE (transglycosylase-associated protein family)